MTKQLDESLYPPCRVKDRNGIVHSYWSKCDMWPDGGKFAADDKPITCLVCLTEEIE